ncbi:type VI secretion system transmembrane protein TssO [Capnocytophaga canis]|uniref:type VI secretion system transmembrane protein TssO n=1 Tax=Capnocytophaga canis TaxID=1848903 RepID=UPI0015627BBD|nr:type VI secretion system transmembrane protein TssO [Capnocytophaga canis]
MDGIISLSKREKRYQFFYLVSMLFVALIVLGVIFFRKFESPFSGTDVLDIQLLSQKNKFVKQQEIVAPLLQNTFTKISILKVEKPQPFVENDIKNSINDIANSFQGTDIYDMRKEAYLQIANFYKMYFEDKKIAAKKTENIRLFEQQFQECSIGFKDKEQELTQKKNAMLSRTN